MTKARGPPAPKLLSKTAGSTAGKIVGAPRRAGPQGHRSVSGEFALSRGVSHPASCCANLDSLAKRSRPAKIHAEAVEAREKKRAEKAAAKEKEAGKAEL